MRRQSSNSDSKKIVVYAVGLAVLLGFGLITIQDIKVPSEHISQTISVDLEK